MAGNGLNLKDINEIKRLWKLGLKKREIARITKVHRNTAQKRISLTEATMVRIFKPGERTEIDYADGIEILDPVTGEVRKTQFFVGVLSEHGDLYKSLLLKVTEKATDGPTPSSCCVDL